MAGSGATLALASFRLCDRGVVWLPSGMARFDAGDESPDFSLRWATKDVDLALAEAGDQTLPVAAAIDHRWHALVEAGLGQADVSAVRQGLARPR